MGMVPDVVVTVVRKAPMGDPIELSLKGYNLSLRQKEAETIVVQEQ
jgi:ferrous iron transport protein A